MSIRLEYIVCNKNGDELNRFDVKSEAEAYDSVICAAEDISLLLEPLQEKMSLSDDQIYAISEHLAFQSEEVKLALKQIKKPKSPTNTIQADKTIEEEQKSSVKKSSKKK
jgi:dsDNA-binding SOS-regulon protein